MITLVETTPTSDRRIRPAVVVALMGWAALSFLFTEHGWWAPAIALPLDLWCVACAVVPMWILERRFGR